MSPKNRVQCLHNQYFDPLGPPKRANLVFPFWGKISRPGGKTLAPDPPLLRPNSPKGKLEANSSKGRKPFQEKGLFPWGFPEMGNLYKAEGAPTPRAPWAAANNLCSMNCFPPKCGKNHWEWE